MASAINLRQNKLQNRHIMLPNKIHIYKNERKYSSVSLNTNNEKTLPAGKLKKTRFFLPYRVYNRTVNKKIFTQNLGVSVVQKQKQHEHKIWHKKISHGSEDNVVTVTNIDKDYFKSINGRPLRLYSPAFKSVQTILNQRLLMKYDKGVIEDCILNIEAEYSNEIKCYNIGVKRLINQAKYLDSFVQQDYKNSMALMEQCEEITMKVQSKTKELQWYAIDLFNIKSKLVGLDYKYNVQQKYGRFLYYLSPQTWRMNNRDFARSMEIEAKGFDLGRLGEDDTFEDVFEKLKNDCCKTPIKPVLYFKNSSEIIEVFDAMEKQQLYYFSHVSHVQPYNKKLKNTIKILKHIISQDYALIDQLINYFKKLIEFTEESCDELEKNFFNILQGLFYKNTGTVNVLRMHINLEYVFEKVFLDLPTNMDIFTVTKELEKFYMEYSKHLDAIKSQSVRNAMVKYAESEKNKLKNAESARTELRLFHRLECRLLRSYGFLPKMSNAYVALSPIDTKGSKNRCAKKRQVQSLCIDDLEYLKLFTDWCPNDSCKETEKYLSGKKEAT